MCTDFLVLSLNAMQFFYSFFTFSLSHFHYMSLQNEVELFFFFKFIYILSLSLNFNIIRILTASFVYFFLPYFILKLSTLLLPSHVNYYHRCYNYFSLFASLLYYKYCLSASYQPLCMAIIIGGFTFFPTRQHFVERDAVCIYACITAG